MKKLTFTLILMTGFFLIGCGSSDNDNNSNTEKTAKDILFGKTLYSTDELLDEPSGYYQITYGENILQESEHAEDGTMIYEPILLNLAYQNRSITVSFGALYETCDISETSNGVLFQCVDHSNQARNFLQWYSPADIQR